MFSPVTISLACVLLALGVLFALCDPTFLRVYLFALTIIGLFIGVTTVLSNIGTRATAPVGEGVSAEVGRAIFFGKGKCSTCHKLGTEGSAVRCPNLGMDDRFADWIGVRAQERARERSGQTGRHYASTDYLVESIADPNAYVVAGFPAGTMPRVYDPPISLIPDEIRSVILFLQSQGGTPDPAGLAEAERRFAEPFAENRPPPPAWEPAVRPDAAKGHALFFQPDSPAGCMKCHTARIPPYSQVIKLWSLPPRGAHPIASLQLEGHTDSVLSVAFAPDGKSFATAGAEGVIKTWDSQTGAALQTFVGHQGAVTSLGFTEQGSRLFTGGRDRSARLWNATTGALLRVFPAEAVTQQAGTTGHTEEISDVAIRGELGLTASLDTTIKVWDLKTGRLVRTFRTHQAPVRSLAIRAELVRSGDDTGRIVSWDLATGTTSWIAEAGSAVLALAVSGDGTRVLAGCRDGKARLWTSGPARATRRQGNQTSPAPLSVSLDVGAEVIAVALSPDGSRAALGSTEERVLLWNLAKNQYAPLRGEFFAPVFALAFSPDGKGLLSGSGMMGAKVGPELTDIAGRQPWTYLQESIMEPSKTIVAQYESYSIVLENGTQKSGRILEGNVQAVLEGKQTTGSLALGYLGGPTGNDVLTESIDIQRIARRGDLGLENEQGTDADVPAIFQQKISVMPGNFREQLTVEQFTNLMAFLLTLTGEPGQPLREAAVSADSSRAGAPTEGWSGASFSSDPSGTGSLRAQGGEHGEQRAQSQLRLRAIP